MTTTVDTASAASDPFAEGLDRETTLRLLSGRFRREDLDAYYRTPHFQRLKAEVIATKMREQGTPEHFSVIESRGAMRVEKFGGYAYNTKRTEGKPLSIGLNDTFGPLLHIDRRDRAGLMWVKTRSRMWLTALKRRRRYGVPRGTVFTPEEGQLIEALTGLEREAGRLLEMIEDEG